VTPNPRPPATLHDVAREAGVSLATASRALNGSTRVVNEAFKQRVLDAAKRLDYTPNRLAQAIVKGTTSTVALFVADIADPYFSSIAAGIIEEADRHGMVVTMATTGWQPRRELELLRAIRSQRPSVLIFAASRASDGDLTSQLREELDALVAGGTRVVFVNGDDAAFRSVNVDNEGGAAKIAGALAGLGYRRYLILSPPPGTRTADDRVRGFHLGLASAGIAPESVRSAQGAFTRDGGHDAMSSVIGAGLGDIEVVFAANDVMAVGAMSAMRGAGIEPGRDIAIAGFDDVPTARDVTPALTTARLPLASIGRQSLLAALDEEPPPSAPIDAEIIVRESTPGIA